MIVLCIFLGGCCQIKVYVCVWYVYIIPVTVIISPLLVHTAPQNSICFQLEHSTKTQKQHLRYITTGGSTTADGAKKPRDYSTHHGTATARYTHRETWSKVGDCIEQTCCTVPVGERTWAWASCGSCWTCGPVSWGWGWGQGERPLKTSRWWAASPLCNAAAHGSPWSGCRKAPALVRHGQFLQVCENVNILCEIQIFFFYKSICLFNSEFLP